MLEDAGWTEGRNWLNEVELRGMPNQSGIGYADYVLYGDDGRPLAVVEAKRTCADVVQGRKQANLYADILEKKYGRRPVIFLYPERRCSMIYSKRDLEKLFNLQTMRSSLSYVVVDKNIAGRYYQEAAIKAVCDSFGKKNRRKALLVMATGSGKTRTVIALVKVLLEHGWVRNILFLYSLSGGQEFSGHAGKAQFHKSSSGPFRDQSGGGKGQLHSPLCILNLPDHDELHRFCRR